MVIILYIPKYTWQVYEFFTCSSWPLFLFFENKLRQTISYKTYCLFKPHKVSSAILRSLQNAFDFKSQWPHAPFTLKTKVFRWIIMQRKKLGKSVVIILSGKRDSIKTKIFSVYSITVQHCQPFSRFFFASRGDFYTVLSPVAAGGVMTDSNPRTCWCLTQVVRCIHTSTTELPHFQNLKIYVTV